MESKGYSNNTKIEVVMNTMSKIFKKIIEILYQNAIISI